MTEYTCPMHPQIEKPKPGACSICGMDLEPKAGGANKEDRELKIMTLRFWIGLVFTLPILLSTMFHLSFGKYDSWIQAALATPVVLWCGWPFFVKGWLSLIHFHLNMFTLISLGISASYIYSMILAFWPEVFPTSLGLYFEAAASITVLVSLGQVLEMKARIKTSQAIQKLLNLAPATARVLVDGTEKEVPLEEVKKGDKLRVRPGEKVPTDGTILEGNSTIDESMITGESLPISKNPKDKVTGATLNESGSFVMQAEKVGSETLLARIVHMVEQAQRSRAPIQKLADVVASYFVPAVVFTAALTFLGWKFFGPPPTLSHGIINGVAVLIIACPCALGLATPVSIMVGVGRGALSGLLIKNAEALETMAKVDTIVFDKTGTLTEGKPKLTNAYGPQEVLQLAASLEVASEHPLARAIVLAAKEKNISLLPVENFQNVKGKGITGKIQNNEIAVGNQQLLKDLNIDPSSLEGKAEELRGKAQTVFYLAVERKAIGLLAVADQIKESTYEAIELLHRNKIRLVMLTGDNRITASAVGKALKIDEVQAEILPEEKHRIVKRLQEEGHIVAMAGDGINDAPALAAANVGIAMGTGTDVAMESAGITLVKGDLRGIARARTLSLATVRNIKQNLWFAFAYNSLGVPIAAGILYPFFGLLLSPIIASAAMTTSSLSVITNALRLRRVKI